MLWLQYQASLAVLESCTLKLHSGSTTTCEFVYCNLCGGFSGDTNVHCNKVNADCTLVGPSLIDIYYTLHLYWWCNAMTGGSTHKHTNYCVQMSTTSTNMSAFTQNDSVCFHFTTVYGVLIHHHTQVHTEPLNWNKNKTWPTSVLQ